jgi:iron complex transport system substrate-binding protein
VAARSPRLIVIVVALLACVLTLSAQRAPARRIISLVPALTEMLFAIGAGSDVIAVSSYDKFPAEVEKLPRVGALLDPDTERILSMRPELVIIYGSQGDLKNQLTRTGIDVFEYRHGGLLHVLSTLRRLGATTGRETEAERVAAGIERRLTEIRTRVAGRPRPRTLLVFGREPLSLRNLYASGGVGFLHDVLELSGGLNVFGDVKRESAQVSTEALLATAPEVIVELRIGETPDSEQIRREREPWMRFTAVPAVRNGRIHILYGDHLVVPGPRLAQAAEEIARAIHPDAFRAARQAN